jgi:hypothetical protein
MTQAQGAVAPVRPTARGVKAGAGRRYVALIPILLGVILLGWLGVSYARTAGQLRVRGLVTNVQSRDIGHAQSLTVEAAGGRVWQFDAAPSVDMTPGHLRDHMALGQPVTVYYHREGSNLVATQVTD